MNIKTLLRLYPKKEYEVIEFHDSIINYEVVDILLDNGFSVSTTDHNIIVVDMDKSNKLWKLLTRLSKTFKFKFTTRMTDEQIVMFDMKKS